MYTSTNGVNDDTYYDINLLSNRQKRDLPALEHNVTNNTDVPVVQTPATLSNNTTVTNAKANASLPEVISGKSNVTRKYI